jgi:hypothetical protein
MTNVNKVQYKRIVVNEKNYRALKGLGSAGDSFNDVITALLKKLSLQQSNGVGAPAIVVNYEQSSTKERNSYG